MIFDPFRKRTISEFGKEEHFILHNAYAPDLKKARELIKSYSKEVGLEEEDIAIDIAVLSFFLWKGKHVLLDFLGGRKGIIESLTFKDIVVDEENLKIYPYVCLLPQLKIFLKNKKEFVVIDLCSQKEGFVIVSILACKGIFSISVPNTETIKDPQRIFSLFREQYGDRFTLLLEDITNISNWQEINKEEEYDFYPVYFREYQDFRQFLGGIKKKSAICALLLCGSLMLNIQTLGYLQKEKELKLQLFEAKKELRILKNRVSILPPEDPFFKRVYIVSKQNEELLEKLPKYSKVLKEIPEEIKFLLPKRGKQNYTVVQILTFNEWLAIKKKIPSARLLTEQYVLIPSEVIRIK